MADTQQRLPGLVQVLVVLTLILAVWRVTAGGLTLVTQAMSGGATSSAFQRGFLPGGDRERVAERTKAMSETLQEALRPWRPWVLGVGALEWAVSVAVLAVCIGTLQRKERSRALLRQLSIACLPLQVAQMTVGFISLRVTSRVMADNPGMLMPTSGEAAKVTATILRATMAFAMVTAALVGLAVLALFAVLAWQLGRDDVRARFAAAQSSPDFPSAQ